MFCGQCGNQVEDNAMFCPKCGSKLINNNEAYRSSDVSDQTPTENTPYTSVETNEQFQGVSATPAQTKPKKKSILLWLIPVIAICVALVVGFGILINTLSTRKEAERAALDYIQDHYCTTFADEMDSIKRTGNNSYIMQYEMKQDYQFWKSSGTIELSVYKDGEEWQFDVLKDDIDFIFADNDNWYRIYAPSNRQALVRIVDLTEDEVTLECYTYRMGSYGTPDDYDHFTITEDLTYDGANLCFNFTYWGNWQIKHNYIQFSKFDVGYYNEYISTGDYQTLYPVDPDDCWWYENAKQQN